MPTKKNNKILTKLKPKMVKLVWGSADSLPTIYANHLFVSHTGQAEFRMVFGLLNSPLILPKTEDDLPDSLIINPVANIIVTPATMKKIVDALTKNLEAYEKEPKEVNSGSKSSK